MGIDIRLPLGLLFAILGLLLTGFGLVSDPSIYARSLGINVNLWWGLVLLVFGGAMLFLWHRARRAAMKRALPPGAEERVSSSGTPAGS